MGRPSRRRALLGLAPLLLVTACGSRTGLAPSRGVSSTAVRSSGGSSSSSSSNHGTPDASAVDASAVLPDPCPFAALVDAPLPMLGNCSTRDGRSRVVGPFGPLVVWSTNLGTYATADDAVGSLAADATGGVYLVSPTGTDGGVSGSSTLVRFLASTGTIDWSVPVDAPTGSTLSPFLPTNGAPELFGTATDGVALNVFALSNGATTSTFLGPLLNEIGIPAIGSDGSLYVTYLQGVAPQPGNFVATRILPDGTLAWTSQDLTNNLSAVEGRTPPLANALPPALGMNGAMIIAINIATYDPNGGPLGEGTFALSSAVTALSTTDGNPLWTTPLPASVVSGPLIGVDGSIVVTTTTTTPSDDPIDASVPDGTLYVLEPTGAIRLRANAQGCVASVVTRDGTILMRGGSVVRAVRATGGTLWSSAPSPGTVVKVTTDLLDTVFVTRSTSIEELDLQTGAATWSVPAPATVPNICDSTLVGREEMVAIGCAQGAFGLRDVPIPPPSP